VCEEKSAIDLSHPNLKAQTYADSDFQQYILLCAILPENVHYLFVSALTPAVVIAAADRA
jgi:hypothetical protein